LLELSSTVVVNAIDNIGKLTAGVVDTDGKLHSLVRHGLRTSKLCLSGGKIIHEDGEQRVKVIIKNLFFCSFFFPNQVFDMSQLTEPEFVNLLTLF
jgi:hypothetical protein